MVNGVEQVTFGRWLNFFLFNYQTKQTKTTKTAEQMDPSTNEEEEEFIRSETE